MALEWIFDPAPPSGARKGGLANAQVFDPSIDSFVREVLQNAIDQRVDEKTRVDVRFHLTELTDESLRAFLKAMEWTSLEPHVRDASQAGGVTIARRLQKGLEEVGSERLRLLLIEDRHTNGLVGGEDEDETNFNALCRHELVTSSSRRESGGSFGIGKSVLWRFSNLSTVLFASMPVDADRWRYFGRVLLPGHAVDGQSYEGSGWFGERDQRPSGARAISVWDEVASTLARGTLMDRKPGSGTSILVVGFDEPALEDERAIEDVGASIVESAARWFWPALLENRLSILVQCNRNEETVFTRHGTADLPEVAPFVRALSDTPQDLDHLETPGDVIERELEFVIPGQRQVPGQEEPPAPATPAKLKLRVRVAESGEDDHAGTVALGRGTGMIVDYKAPRRRLGSDVRFHAVLLAGLAHGSAKSDRAAERFLRAAEPPAHGDWTARTERIKTEYQPGAGVALEGLFAEVDTVLRDVFRAEVAESDEGPDALRRLFPMPGAGPVSTSPYYRLSGAHASLAATTWHFGATYERREAGEEEWHFRVGLILDQEASGGVASGDRVRIEALSASPTSGVSVSIDSDGTALVKAPADVKSVSFVGQSEDLAGLPGHGAERVRLRLDVRTLTITGQSS